MAVRGEGIRRVILSSPISTNMGVNQVVTGFTPIFHPKINDSKYDLSKKFRNNGSLCFVLAQRTIIFAVK